MTDEEKLFEVLKEGGVILAAPDIFQAIKTKVDERKGRLLHEIEVVESSLLEKGSIVAMKKQKPNYEIGLTELPPQIFDLPQWRDLPEIKDEFW